MKTECSYTELVDTDLLQPHPRNANKHTDEQIKLLAKIMKHQGWRNPIVVSNRSGFIVAGHGRLLAAKLNKWEKCPVDKQDFATEADEYSHLIADNKIAELADTDMSMVNLDVAEFGPEFDIDLLGIPDFKLDVAEHYDEETEDDVPEAPKEATSKLGDLYILGNHRLLCGDATNVQHVNKLMDGNNADIVYTDPPYGMNAVSKSGVLSKNYKKDIMGDDNPDVAKDSFRLIYGMFEKSKHVWWGANYYSSVLPDSECWAVWNKNNGESDQTDCELAWCNFRSVVRMFTKSSEKTNRVHPTQKPVSLIEWVFRRFKYSAETLLDPFGGSGSTLIACEKTNRKCFMMELDPIYVDVIVSRWEKYTGKKAELQNAN